MALAPWVLLPLVKGSTEGSVRRAAVVSALVVATSGGVNAVAVAATLPLGVIWILTRAPGPRRWPLLGWWTLFTAVATLWWSLPLMVMGRYSPPFLDYIENATITTIPTGVARSLLGASDWVAYFAGIDYTAGQQIVTTPFLLLNAAAISAAGLIGIAMRGNPHRRFLMLGVLTGLALVGFGYSGEMAGFFADDRTGWLDQALAPLRNLHKFDVVLRIPLVLGLAHLLAALPAILDGRGTRLGLFTVRLATVLALVALALPWAHDNIAPRDGVLKVPDYWSQVADYLEETDDGTVALEVPASAFGVYTWGNTHDDVLQGLAQSPWAVRNVIPLAQPGNVVFLDAVTRYLESGHPSDAFARFLASNGVGRLVVRNDLDRFATGAPDPAYVASVLQQASGIELAKSFGPTVGVPAHSQAPDDGPRIVEGGGLASEVGSVDVYDVAGAATAYLTRDAKAMEGDPGSTLDETVDETGAGQLLLAADTPAIGAAKPTGQVLTDGMRRRETNFAAVRWNESSTMQAGQDYVLVGPEHEHRLTDDPERWQTTETWSGGVTSVTASSSEASANSQTPLRIGDHAGAAVDGDPATAWRSARHLDPTGSFWQETFDGPTRINTVVVSLAADSAPVDQLEFWAGGERITAPAPTPGQSRSYLTRFGEATFLRITAAGDDLVLPGSFAISEVRLPGVSPLRSMTLPKPDADLSVDLVSLTRDPDRAACVTVGDSFPCVGALTAPGEDGDTLARRFEVPRTASYDVAGTVSLRRTVPGISISGTGLTATSDAGAPFDVAAGPTAMLDGDPGTTWISGSPDERLTVEFPKPRRLDTIDVAVSPGAAAARPTLLRVSSGDRTSVVSLDGFGIGQLPRWQVSSLDIAVLATDQTVVVQGLSFVAAPAGISSLTFGDADKAADEEKAATQDRRFGCGSGPDLELDGRTLRTSVTASSFDLMRGASVPFEICGSDQTVVSGGVRHSLTAEPSDRFRIDSLTLARQGASSASTQTLEVNRDGRGNPTTVGLPERADATILTLPQNQNAGWVATLDGKELAPTRVDGWKQAWVVPAGAAGTVHLSYPPNTTFTWALVIGALGLLACVVIALLCLRAARRRPASDLPPLTAGGVGLLDLAVIAVVPALLAGWWGVIATVLALGLAALTRDRFRGWPTLAGLAYLVGALAMVWSPLTDRSWAVEWTQAWSLVAVAALVAALATELRLRRRDEWPSALGLAGDDRRADIGCRHADLGVRGESGQVDLVILPGRRHLEHVRAGLQLGLDDGRASGDEGRGVLGRLVGEAQPPDVAEDRPVELDGAAGGLDRRAVVAPGRCPLGRIHPADDVEAGMHQHAVLVDGVVVVLDAPSG